MKKLIFIFIAISFLLFSEENVISLIDENYPPYTYLEGEKIKGMRTTSSC